jgi:hypothetical protein
MIITAIRGDIPYVLSQHRPAKVYGDDVVCACGERFDDRQGFTHHQTRKIAERSAK